MTLKLNGTTSGSVSIDAPATGSNVSFTLPGSVGTSGQLLSTNGSGVLSFVNGGKILQVVRATDTTNRNTTSTTFVDANLSVTITPQKSDSAVLLLASFYHGQAGGAADCRGVFRITDSSNNGISGGGEVAGGIVSNAQTDRQVLMLAYVTPATTSAVTYKLRFRTVNASSTTVLENSAQTAQMFAIEVSA